VAALVLMALAGGGLVSVVEQHDAWGRATPQVREPNQSWISGKELRAYRWLRDHSGPDDIVMTNQHCRGRTYNKCDRRRFYISGYTERGVLIEGWSYTREASKAYDPDGELNFTQVPFHDQDLLALNDGFITAPTAEAAAELWDLGVRWVVVRDTAPHAKTLEPFAVERRSVGPVKIYELVETP
jgi:hypothetical protein